MTDNQISANRANAQLSTGPRTEAGKNRSRMNSRRHGLTGQVSTMPAEDRAAHDKFSKALIDDLAPSGAMETQLAQRIATDSWRLNRLSAIEDNIYALGDLRNAPNLTPDPSSENTSAHNDQISSALAMAVTFTDHSAELQRLSLYEQRLNGAIRKNLAELKKLQAERKSAEAAQLEEAKLLLQLADSKGECYDPSPSGQAEGPSCAPQKTAFVFSIAQIRAAIHRDRRLAEARRPEPPTRNPGKPLTKAA